MVSVNQLAPRERAVDFRAVLVGYSQQQETVSPDRELETTIFSSRDDVN